MPFNVLWMPAFSMVGLSTHVCVAMREFPEFCACVCITIISSTTVYVLLSLHEDNNGNTWFSCAET